MPTPLLAIEAKAGQLQGGLEGAERFCLDRRAAQQSPDGPRGHLLKPGTSSLQENRPGVGDPWQPNRQALGQAHRPPPRHDAHQADAPWSPSPQSEAPQTHTVYTYRNLGPGRLLCLLHLKRGPHCKTKHELGILPPTSKLSRQRGGSRINSLNYSTNFPRGGPTAFLLCPLPSRCLPL